MLGYEIYRGGVDAKSYQLSNFHGGIVKLWGKYAYNGVVVLFLMMILWIQDGDTAYFARCFGNCIHLCMILVASYYSYIFGMWGRANKSVKL